MNASPQKMGGRGNVACDIGFMFHDFPERCHFTRVREMPELLRRTPAALQLTSEAAL